MSAVGIACLISVPALLAAPAASARPDNPSDREIKQNKQQVEERAAAVEDIEKKLEKARKQLKPLTAKADKLVKKYYRQQAQLEQAKQQYSKAKERHEDTQHKLQKARDAVGALAADQYRSSGSLGKLGKLLGSEGPQQVAERMNGYRIAARNRAATLDRLRAARIVAEVTRKQAQQALADQRSATRQVKRSKKKAQQAVQEQQQEIKQIQQLEDKLRDKLADARTRSEKLQDQREEYREWRQEQREKRRRREARRERRKEAKEARKQAQEAQQAATQATKDTAAASGQDCEDKPVSKKGYSNGLIPPQALCPLPQDGHLLRADAAAAFVQLNAAYADEFGEPICVTDSYRTLAVQQRLARTKPELAAEPGTSNHGWGVALDLCGGINDFGTSEREWMVDNASEYGWTSPEWAQADGSLPEPWHWEYTG